MHRLRSPPESWPTSSELPTRSGRAIERITPQAVTVVSTAHYQVTLSLTCNTAQGYCAGNFPAVPGRRRLTLTRMSCYTRSSTYASFSAGRIALEPGGAVQEYLPVDHSTEWGYHVLNRAIAVYLIPRQYIFVALQLASGGQPSKATAPRTVRSKRCSKDDAVTDPVAYSHAPGQRHRAACALRNAWRALWVARRVRAELSALSNVELKDLWLSQCQIDAVATGAFSR